MFLFNLISSGFEKSDSRNLLTSTLTSIGFDFQEFLLNPTQIGIPNSRLRYYLIGKKRPERFPFETRSELQTHFEFSFCPELGEKFQLLTKKSLELFLSNLDEETEKSFEVPDKVLKKVKKVF